MKTNTIATIVALGLLPITGFSQTPPTPPTPQTPSVAPVPPVPPVPPPSRGDRDRERLPKVPITYLGVETSSVPSVVAEQLGLAKGFGLVVDYVVPDGPAAAAGLQANDILKMLNDQILLEPDQLSKLIRSYSEGTSVTLTVLRKGAETKLTAKLGKREVSQRRGMLPGWKHGDGFGDLGPEFEREMREFNEEMGRNGEELGRQLREKMGDGKFGLVGDAVGSAREEIKRAREEARRSGEEGRRAAEEGRRAAAEGRRAADEARRVAEKGRGKTGNSVRVVTSNDNGVLKT
ncbi:MAG: PDZ domain-containing protein, partial [Chthoniobacterales bacterium]|nr:PDZ domain-containing protein [Chthoniobacterales bacterium]